jgi:hypothetical protein
MIRILATRGTIFIVIGDSAQHLDIAKRFAHDLYVYHRVDCVILQDEEAFSKVASNQLGAGNLVVLGRPEENRFAEYMIAQKTIPGRSALMSAREVANGDCTRSCCSNPRRYDDCGQAGI